MKSFRIPIVLSVFLLSFGLLTLFIMSVSQTLAAPAQQSGVDTERPEVQETETKESVQQSGIETEQSGGQEVEIYVSSGSLAAPIVCNAGPIDFDTGIPVDWVVVNNVPSNPVVWTDVISSGEAANYTGGTGDAASASSDLQGGGSGMYDTELQTPPIDLSGVGSAELSYWANYQNFALVDFLDLDISTDGGANWTTVLSWNEDHGAFRNSPGEFVQVNLDAYVGQTVILRWHYYDPGASTAQDWYAQIDDVALTCPIGPNIALEKTVGTDPSVCATNDAVIVSGPTDVTYCYEVTNTGTVTFTSHDLDDSELGTILAGFPFSLAPGASAFLTSSATITQTTVNTATWAATDGVTTAVDIDTATVTVLTSASYPVCEGFESGSLPNFMFAETTSDGGANGRVVITDTFPHTGSYAMNIDTDCDGCGGFTLQSGTMLVDLAGQSGVELNLWVHEHSDENNAEDGIFVSDDGGSTWVQIFSLNGFPANYENVFLDLDTAVANAGMSYVDGFMIRFQSFDDFSIPTDGYSFDDICLQPAQPDISVTPDSLASNQFADELVTQTLAIDNSGSLTLTWDMVEAASDCATPGDIAWASASPVSGTIPSLGSNGVDVVFDSTGLAPAVYNGLLCVNSDDPDTPLITVSLALTVEASPAIVVSPSSLSSTQKTDTQMTQTLTISNVGTADLDWDITEVAPRIQAKPLEPIIAVPAIGNAETAHGYTSLSAANVKSGNGPTIASHFTDAPPVLDGSIGAGEWDSAFEMDISVTAQPVLMYIMHDADTLYLAFNDQNDTTLDSLDQIGVYFDDEGGTPPILWDNVWINAVCAGGPNMGEGNYWFGNFGTPDDQWREWIVGPTACPVQLGSTNVQITYGVSDGTMVYEVAIPLDGSSALTAGLNEEFGYRVYTLDNVGGSATFTGFFPVGSIFNDPSTYGNLQLPGASCDPNDVSWASVSPISGTTSVGSATDVNVTFDSAGLAIGVYTGTLCVNSNDPFNPVVEVPLELNVVTNTAPVAVDDAYIMDQDTVLTVTVPGVLDNDSDVDGDVLTAVLDTDVTSGTLSLNADGSFTYTPDAGFVGTDSFTYHANDGTDDSNVVTVMITVEEVIYTLYLPFVAKE